MKSFYRAHEMAVWNRLIPTIVKSGSNGSEGFHHHAFFPTPRSGPSGIPVEASPQVEAALPVSTPLPRVPSPVSHPTNATALEESSSPVEETERAALLSLTVGVGTLLLIVNASFFAVIYYRRLKHRHRYRVDRDVASSDPAAAEQDELRTFEIVY